MRLRGGFGMTILRSPDGDEGTGGGSASDGRNTSGASGAAGGITEEKVKQIINETVNVTFSKRIRDLESKQTKAFEAFGQTILSKVSETLTESLGAQLAEALEERGIRPGKSGKDSSASDDITKNPQYVGLLRQQEEQKKLIDRMAAERAAEKTALRNSNLQKTLMEALADQGIDGKRARLAAAALLHENRVKYEGDDSESVVFVDDDAVAVDLKTGMKDWAKSEDGKLYLPARGASGSGDNPARGGIANGGQPSPKAELGSALQKLLNGDFG